MASIAELLARAAALRDETALNSISPERAGGIMYDTLVAMNELWLQQGAALVISKIYASVEAMEADTAPVSDLTGQALRPGQIVVIASSDEDNGSVYRYDGPADPSWSAVGNIGAVPVVDDLTSDSSILALAARQGKVLDEKIGLLRRDIGAEVVSSFNLVISSSVQSKRVDIEKALKGRFKIAFNGGSASAFACKVFLYRGSTASQNLVWESAPFGFNSFVEYDGDEFDIVIFNVYGDMVITEGVADAVIELGIQAQISRLEERAGAYSRGIIVQTAGDLSDSFDMDGTAAIMKKHRKNFDTLVRQIRQFYPDCLPMGAGTCRLCRSCTYPGRPCRHPDKMVSSMEAYGLLVSDVAIRSGH